MPQPQVKKVPSRAMLPRGERFAGRFQILDTAGNGAESVVYKVRDIETGAVLALKVYDDQYGKDPKRRQAFQREVELGGKIIHPNVVRILGAGEAEGQSFILMEFLSGRTLAEAMQIAQRFPAEEVLALFRQMAAAIVCLHSNGIVHRDIKPANLMFAADGTLKLMDFGIARRYGDAVTVGVARGTVDYAAPEQLLGKEPTAASDLFALAAVCLELLTGEKPFRGQSQMERCTQPPPALRALTPGLPRSLSTALEQCLQPDPSQRPPSAQALLEASGIEVPAPAPQMPMPPAPPVAQAQPAREHPPAVERPPAPAPPPAPPARTLTLLLEDDPRSHMEALPVFASLLSILRRITDAGDAHDPVTPETVRLRPDGSAEISRRSNPGDQDTWVISTPRYSAPELLHGEISLSDRGRTAAVLYSAGFIFYEILIGRSQFKREFRDVLRKSSDLAWMEWQANLELHPRPLKDVLPDCPADLSALFEQLLQKDPAKRPSAYREVEMAVRRLMHQSAPTEEIATPLVPEIEAAEPETPMDPPPQRMHPTMTALVVFAVAVALALVGAAVGWSLGLIEIGR
jgi:serine/threonine protein kinase